MARILNFARCRDHPAGADFGSTAQIVRKALFLQCGSQCGTMKDT